MNEKQLSYESEWRLQSVLSGEARTVEIAGSKLTVPDERKFADLENVQKYVNTVLRLPNVRRRWPKVTRDVAVRGVKFRAKATYDPSKKEILIPTHDLYAGTGWAMRESVLIHEIAHHLEQDSHGPRWRGAFCFLLEDCIAPEAGFMLRVFMDMEGLQVVDTTV